MSILRALLFPFSLLYHVLTAVRNRMYDIGLKPAVSFDLPVIGVGNLTVGGTGKTPMVEYLVRLFRAQHKVGIVSRGYGRAVSGIRVANMHDTAASIGDEPHQYFRKFGNDVAVAVGSDRALTIACLLQEREDIDLILLDDALQHRRVRPGFQVLLTDYHRPFYRDYLLPAGNLREARVNARRADVVVVTKCPRDISDSDMAQIVQRINRYTGRSVFFSTLRYGSPRPFGFSRMRDIDRVVLVTGIASPGPLREYIASRFNLVHHLDFADHHNYSERDLVNICAEARRLDAVVITTEKDATKLDATQFASFVEEITFYALPVEIEFLKNGKDFDDMLFKAIENVSKSQGN